MPEPKSQEHQTVYADGRQGKTYRIDADGRCWITHDEMGNKLVPMETYGTGEPLEWRHSAPYLDYRQHNN